MNMEKLPKESLTASQAGRERERGRCNKYDVCDENVLIFHEVEKTLKKRGKHFVWYNLSLSQPVAQQGNRNTC